MKIQIFLSFLFFLLSGYRVKAQVVINEFSSNSNPEWVELYNTTLDTMDITNWKLQDKVQDPELLNGLIIGHGFFVFEKSKGWLNDLKGDTITLKNNLDNIIDSIIYDQNDSMLDTPKPNKSTGRFPDGSNNWQNNTDWTKGFPNSMPSPTPTIIPSPTLEPTQTPTSTKTPAPTKTPTPAPEPTKSSTPTSKPPAVISANLPSIVLGIQEETQNNSPVPTSEPENPKENKTESKSKFPITSVIFIFLGVAFIGSAAYPLIKQRFTQEP